MKGFQHRELLQKCKSKKYKEVSAHNGHNGQNGLCQKALNTIKAGEVVEKREPSYADAGTVSC